MKVGAELFCGVVFVCPRGGVVGKRRGVMPAGSHLSLVNTWAGMGTIPIRRGENKTDTERTVSGIGSPKTLKAVKTKFAGQKVRSVR